MSRLRVIGHRGGLAHGPENTIEAARTAAPHVDMVEIDVQRCGTGEIVVFHDTMLDRLTNTSGAVPRTPWETLRTLTIGDSDATIPLFSTFLESIPDELAVNVELKHAGIAEAVLAIATRAPNDVLVSSFDPHAIAPIAHHETAYLFHDGSMDSWTGALDIADALDCDAVHPHYELLTPDRIADAHERGFAVNAWTVPDRVAVDRLRDGGVDGVIVDDWQIATT